MKPSGYFKWQSPFYIHHTHTRGADEPIDVSRRPHTALWMLPPYHSHAHVPERTSLIHPSITRLATIMGRSAEEVEEEIHLVIARQFAKGRLLPLDAAVDCHGKAQAFFDGIHGRDWPE